MKQSVIKQILAVAFAGALLAGCAGEPMKEEKAAAPSPEMAAAKQAIADADAARKKAATVRGEWRDTKKMIKKAKKAMEAGDYAKAKKLADKAKGQGEMGYAQAVAEKKKFMEAGVKLN